MIAQELRIDPVTVLDEVDLGRQSARLGAALVIQRNRKKQEQEAARARQKPLI